MQKAVDDQQQWDELLSRENPEAWQERISPFVTLMMQYRCALLEVETKLRVLDAEFSTRYDRNPFESIKTRLKTPQSIGDKLKRKGYPFTLKSIEDNLFNVAGVRVVCSFPEDIYTLAELLIQQDDISLLARKDYIAHPKENGYRSLHLIVEVPIFLSGGKKHMKVEVQFRTIAMDFWASLEHKLRYKKELCEPEQTAERLKRCADQIAQLDDEMQAIRHVIDAEKNL